MYPVTLKFFGTSKSAIKASFLYACKPSEFELEQPSYIPSYNCIKIGCVFFAPNAQKIVLKRGPTL